MAVARPMAAMLGALFLVAAAVALPTPCRASDQPALSQAQTALFATNHLAAISRPETLDYTFRHDGAEPYGDTVSLSVRAVHEDGSKDVAVAFLSGSRRVEMPEVARFHGNPLIMYFLEWDVRAMQRATGGAAVYFRNRIRDAFAEAQTEDATITIDGRKQPATMIVLQPYLHDPAVARFAGLRDKTYRFVLAKAVPGMVYEIDTTVPAADKGGKPTGDRLRFAGVEP
ncbi:MAG TPA: hypothetical protein VFQ82_14095 [Stellaceae bacterium]|jgi:hypothetical protein|nr:hypothetical protein [Stellaceae bacterium]